MNALTMLVMWTKSKILCKFLDNIFLTDIYFGQKSMSLQTHVRYEFQACLIALLYTFLLCGVLSHRAALYCR